MDLESVVVRMEVCLVEIDYSATMLFAARDSKNYDCPGLVLCIKVRSPLTTIIFPLNHEHIYQVEL